MGIYEIFESLTKLLSNIRSRVKKWGNYILMWNFLEEQDFIMET